MKYPNTWPYSGEERNAYWGLIREKAKLLRSNGCSKVPEFYNIACFEHDIHFKVGRKQVLGISVSHIDGRKHFRLENGVPITFEWANERFRRAIQSFSPFGKFSPMSWWRWWAVGKFSRGVWDRYRKERG